MVGPPFAQLNLGSAVAAAAAVTCCRLSISCSGWLDGSEAADVAVVVAIDPELDMEPQCEKKDIWVARGNTRSIQLSSPDLGTCRVKMIHLKIAISEDNSALLCPWLNCFLSVFSCELIFWMIFSTISEGRPELLEPAYIRASIL